MHKSTLETHHQPIMPVLALVLATFFWGSSFITVGSALEYTNPLTLVMLRFGVAAFFVLLMLKGRIADIPKRTWKAGAACAFLIYLGYTTNAAGLMTLQSSESGFLTALYVPITPLLVWVVFGKAPTKGAVFGVMMAFADLVLLANPFTLSFSNNWGEWVTILSALISAVEIMVVGRVAPGTQARQLAFTQLFFTAVFAAPRRQASRSRRRPSTRRWWAASSGLPSSSPLCRCCSPGRSATYLRAARPSSSPWRASLPPSSVGSQAKASERRASSAAS